MLVHPQFDPIALDLHRFGIPVAVHWYGLTYLVGFGLFLFLAIRRTGLPQFAVRGWSRRDGNDGNRSAQLSCGGQKARSGGADVASGREVNENENVGHRSIPIDQLGIRQESGQLLTGSAVVDDGDAGGFGGPDGNCHHAGRGLCAGHVRPGQPHLDGAEIIDLLLLGLHDSAKCREAGFRGALGHRHDGGKRGRDTLQTPPRVAITADPIGLNRH